MPYPSTISTFTNPQPTDKLNSPSHSSIETAQNTGLTELQTFLGTLSSTAGTIIYDVRAAASDGGGHVQTANKGGTGQTSYNKGDVLVATSSSVLAKLTVGTDNQVLAANSSAASGVNWKTLTNSTNKIANSASIVFVSSVAAETSLFSVPVPGSTLGTSNAVRATVFIRHLATDGASSILLAANYGATTVASMLLTGGVGIPASLPSIRGTMTFNLIANNSTTAQRGIFNLNVSRDQLDTTHIASSSVVGRITGYLSGAAAEDSSAIKNIGMTVKFPTSNLNQFAIDGYTVEQIT